MFPKASKPMPELTVAAGLARELAKLAVSKGAGEVALLSRSGIALGDLADQDNRIPFSKYVALMRAGEELCGDAALGLHFGESSDLARISVVGLIHEASETMLEAVAQLNRYGRLVVEFGGGPDRFRLVREHGGLWLVDARNDPNDFPELTESTFARMVCGARRAGYPPLVRQVHVTHPEPAYRAEYDRVFRIPVTFCAGWNAMELEEAWLTVPMQRQPRYVFGILSEHADALLAALANSKSTRGRVENLLIPILHTGKASMDLIAGEMAMSRRTLFRKLKADGTTFEKVLDELRHKLALHYLGGKKVSVNEAAYLVGFSSAAPFSRAFKRWTGRNPRDARRA